MLNAMAETLWFLMERSTASAPFVGHPVRAESFLNLDKLKAAPDVRWMVTTPQDLRQVAGEISQMTQEERHRWQKRASEIVRSALAPMTPQCVDAFIVQD